MKRNKKTRIIIILIITIALIISMIIPVRKQDEIIYEHEFDDGGTPCVCYYNIWGIKIKTDAQKNKR